MGAAISQKITRDELKKIKEAFDKDGLSGVIDQCDFDLNLLKNTTLDIAITGETGSGKSSLVNALRGMTDFEEGSAPIGVTETTMEAKGYQHPTFSKVTIWDLPGIGSLRFKAKDYLKMVKFERYDFFMILASERFRENDVLLAHEIQKLRKKFYYARTKVDVDLDSERMRPTFKEEETLRQLREHCCEKLKVAGETNPRVFLISNRDLSKYDFPLLQKTLENDLDDLKRYALITTMPNLSRDILKKKKDAMLGLIWALSIVSGIGGTIHVPGISIVCDLSILIGSMIDFCKAFGLDDDSLRRLARRVGKPFPVLRSAIKKSREANGITPEFVRSLLEKSTVPYLDMDSLSRLASLAGEPLPVLVEAARKYCAGNKITAEFVKDILEKSPMFAKMAAPEFALDFKPVLGSVFGAISSFATMFYMLKTFLDSVVEDAENLLAKVAEC